MRRPIIKDTILKNLQMIYWQALKDNKLDIALQATEQQILCMGLLEKPSSPSQRLPEVTRSQDTAEDHPTGEQQAQHMGLLEKQSLPSQRLPEVMRLQDMTEGQLRDYIAALEKLDPSLMELTPDLEHPPPPTRV